jgi:hypothetical protein
MPTSRGPTRTGAKHDGQNLTERLLHLCLSCKRALLLSHLWSLSSVEHATNPCAPGHLSY